MKLLTFLLITISCFISLQAQDSLDYFPLHVGDYWEYWTWPPTYQAMFYSIPSDTLMPNGKKYFKVIKKYSAHPNPGSEMITYFHKDSNKVYQYLPVPGCLDKGLVYYDFLSPDKSLWKLCYGPDYKGCYQTRSFYVPIQQDTLLTKTFEYAAISNNGDTLWSPTNYRAFEDLSQGLGVTRSLEDGEGFFVLTGAIIDGKKYGIITGIPESSEPIIEDALDVYPNPSNGLFNINFILKRSSTINLRLFNNIGEIVYECLNQDYQSGSHMLKINTSNLSSGFYIVILNTGEKILSKKLVNLK